MNVAVVIGRTPDDAGAAWTADLLASLDGCAWPVEVNQTWDFELATIAWAARHLDEFVFLPAATVVKDLAVFDLAFGDLAGKSVNLGGVQQGYRFRMYLGKYLASSVLELGIPTVTSKAMAVEQELRWGEDYAQQEEHAGRFAELGGSFQISDATSEGQVERHGRTNLVVENQYLRRYQGTWNTSMIRERVT